MIKSNKNNKKKKGFTLVELIAVIAIIGILAAILVPTVNGYITKARKVKVVEQARQWYMAAEAVKAEGKLAPAATDKPADHTAAIAEIIATAKLDLIVDLKYSEANDIVNNGKEFDLKADNKTFDKVK